MFAVFNAFLSKRKKIFPNNNSNFQIPKPPELSLEVGRLKKHYEAQARSYTDVFIPELDWSKIQKLKGIDIQSPLNSPLYAMVVQ